MRRFFSSLIAVVVLCLTGCAHIPSSVEPPEVTLADMLPAGSTLFEHRINVGLRVRNTNDFSLSVYGIRCALTVNGRPLLRGTSRERVSIPALSSRVLRLEGVVTALDLLQQFRGMSTREDPTYDLTGEIYLSRDLRRSVSFARKGALPAFPGTP